MNHKHSGLELHPYDLLPKFTEIKCPKCGQRFVQTDRFGVFCTFRSCTWRQDDPNTTHVGTQLEKDKQADPVEEDLQLPIYPEGTEECIHCLGDGRYNNGLLIQNCPTCKGRGYRKIIHKEHDKANERMV